MKAITRMAVVLPLVSGIGLAMAGIAGAAEDRDTYRGDGKRMECEHREHRMGAHHGPGHDGEHARHARQEACGKHAAEHGHKGDKGEQCPFRQAPKPDDEA